MEIPMFSINSFLYHYYGYSFCDRYSQYQRVLRQRWLSRQMPLAASRGSALGDRWRCRKRAKLVLRSREQKRWLVVCLVPWFSKFCANIYRIWGVLQIFRVRSVTCGHFLCYIALFAPKSIKSYKNHKKAWICLRISKKSSIFAAKITK